MPIERDDFLRPGVLEKQGRVVRGKAQPKPEVAGTKSWGTLKSRRSNWSRTKAPEAIGPARISQYTGCVVGNPYLRIISGLPSVRNRWQG